jgi:hypothetical protein
MFATYHTPPKAVIMIGPIMIANHDPFGLEGSIS